MVTNAELIAIVKARNEADRDLREVRDRLRGIGDQAEETGSSWDRAWAAFEQNATKAALAVSGAGAAIEAMARGQQDRNRDIRVFAEGLGITESEARKMATSISSATTPLDDAIGLMDQARRRGLEGQALLDYANFWSTVGDATGESAVELSAASSGLRAVGLAAGEEGQALDAFGFITENTTQGVGDFLTLLDRRGPAIREFGLGVDDTAALLAVMERELGYTSRTARQQFERAINESDGTLEGLLSTLGISEESFNEMRGAVEGSAEAIERNAQILADSKTPLQNMQAWVQDVVFEHAQWIEKAAQLSPLMLALGPIVKGVAVIGGPAIGFARDLTRNLGEMHAIIRTAGGSGGTIAGYSNVLRTTLTSALRSPIGAIGALGLGLGAVELGLRAITGEGLIGNLNRLLGASRREGQAAAEAIDRVNVLMEAAGTSVLTAEIAHQALAESYRDVVAAVDEVDRSITSFVELMLIMGPGAAREAAESVEALGARMVEAQIPAEDIVAEWEKMPDALKDIFYEAANVEHSLAVIDERQQQLNESAAAARGELAANAVSWSDVQAHIDATSTSLDDAAQLWDGVFADILPAAVQEWEAATGKSFEGFRTEIPPTISTLDELKGFLETSLGPDGAAALDSLRASAQQSFEGIKSSVRGVLPTVNEEFSAWQSRIQEMVRAHENFDTNIETILGGIPPEYSHMTGLIGGILREQGPQITQQMADYFAENPEGTIDTFLSALPVMYGDGLTATELAILQHEGTMDAATAAAFTTPVETATDAALEAASTAGAAIPADAAAAIEADAHLLETAAEGAFLDNVTAAGEDALGEADRVGGQIPVDAAAALDANASTLATAAQDAVSGAISNVDTSASAGVGVDMVNGIVRGISSAGSRVGTAMSRVVRQGIDRAKAEAGIESPSRVMRDEVGVPMAEGLAGGLADGFARSVLPGIDRHAADLIGRFSQVHPAIDRFTARLVDRFASGAVGIGDVMRELAHVYGISAERMIDVSERMYWEAGHSFTGMVRGVVDGSISIGAAIEEIEWQIGRVPTAAAAAASGFNSSLSDMILTMRRFAALEAPTIREAFVYAMTLGDEERRLVDEFGETGAKAIDAFTRALAGGDTQSALALADVIQDMIAEAEAQGVPEARALGDELRKAIALALADGADEAVDAARDLIKAYTDTIAAADPDLAAAGSGAVDTFMDGYNRSVRDRRMIEQFGSDGKRMIDALNAELDKGGAAAFDRIGSMTHGMLQKLTDGLDPSESGHVTRVFMDAINDVIDTRGEEAMQRLRDLLEQIEGRGVESVIRPTREVPSDEPIIRLAGLQSFVGSEWSTGGRRIEVPLSELAAAMDAHGLSRSAVAAELAKHGLDWGAIPGFGGGGIVPGPIGSPQLAVVHGGEEIRTPAQQRATVTIAPNAINITIEGNADEATVERGVRRALERVLDEQFGTEAQMWGVAT